MILKCPDHRAFFCPIFRKMPSPEFYFPEIPVFVDSPYIKSDPDPFGFPQHKYISEFAHSERINASDDPCIIIATSGMMEGGRIQQHLKSNISDPRNAVCITGYCEPSTIGGKLSWGDRTISIKEETFHVNTAILFMKEYSTQADFSDILTFIDQHDKARVKAVFLVLGKKSLWKN
jgi:metallo-beta-lactamase family protein